MRRALVPLALLIVAAGAAWQTQRADSAADDPPAQSQSAPTAAVTPVLSARRVPAFIQTPAADELLATDLAAVAAVAPPATCLVVQEDGRPIYAHNPDLPVIPASTHKLLTAAAAYRELGPDYTFTTQIVANAADADGVVAGDVWMVGGGDPVLETDAFIARYDHPVPNTDVEALADQIAAAGISRITGNLVADESRYDSERYVASWPTRFTNTSQNQTGPLSALMVDEGFISPFPDDPADRAAATATPEPAVHAAGVMRVLLALRGVTVEGAIVPGEAPDTATTVLGAVESPPLTDIVDAMLADSDNTIAELLLKELGFRATGLGSTRGGADAMLPSLRQLGIRTEGLVIDDGSGLSPLDRVTCTQLVALLETTDLTGGLAVAGESGTLAGRFLETELVGRLRGKTGSLNDVRSLAGFTETVDGDRLTFALIVNEDQIGNDGIALSLQDVVALQMVEYPDGPPLETLDPQ